MVSVSSTASFCIAQAASVSGKQLKQTCQVFFQQAEMRVDLVVKLDVLSQSDPKPR